MAQQKDTHKNTRLIPGRAGELTPVANNITFDLLEYIFGLDGPYRRVLKHFGVKLRDSSESFLILHNSTVYSDLDKEQAILWGEYPLVLTEANHQITAEFSITKLNPVTSYNYFKKIVFDSLLILRLEKYVAEAFFLYTKASNSIKTIYETKTLSLKDFLTIYEDIVYVSYLYEIVDLYNISKSSNSVTKQYITANDYLLRSDPKFVELSLKLPKGFYLDDYENLESSLTNTDSREFIPSSLPKLGTFKDLPQIQAYEVELQCLKNNLRLKTNVLLYFLNLTLLRKAKSKNVQFIGDLKLDLVD